MDEITYWIHTKRAPCLMAYDRAVNAQVRTKPNVVTKPPPNPKPSPVPSPEKKRKRKLSVLDDESDDVEKKQNVYFEDCQKIKQAVFGSDKTVTDSDVDFNIKNSPYLPKNRQLKNGKVPNRKKLITSTPKTKAVVRRSSRKLRTSLNIDSPTKETLNGFTVNIQKVNGSKFENKHHVSEVLNNTCEDTVPNVDTRPSEKVTLQFDDMSDVSGFTANYIRSTKQHTNKSRGNLKNKHNRIVVNETKNVSSPINDRDKIVSNTLETANEKLGTTFMTETVNNNTSHNTPELRPTRNRNSSNRKNTSKVDPNISSINCSTSRYPIRNKRIKLNDSSDMMEKDLITVGELSRTRSGRFIGQQCTESASPVKTDTSRCKKKLSWVKSVDCAKKVNNKSGQSTKKDSVRSKSFAECFSDSEDDCRPMNQGKFFCV